ncbi:MAG: hypothetical protein ACREIA_07700 [Opitutaceae bacterium]
MELYDASATNLTSHLVNLSTRGFVGSGEDVLIPGFVVSHEGPKTVLIRAVGPGLADVGIPTGFLADPKLTVFVSQNGQSRELFSNDDWQTAFDPAYTAEIANRVGAFPLASGSKDAALVLTLQPGIYSFHASGAGDGAGIALVEVYEVP